MRSPKDDVLVVPKAQASETASEGIGTARVYNESGTV
jgi:hypothetical protein